MNEAIVISHITLNSGHNRNSTTADNIFGDQLFDALVPVVRKALTSKHAIIPWVEDRYSLTGGCEGRDSIFTVCGRSRLFGSKWVPIVEVGIGAGENDAEIWKDLYLIAEDTQSEVKVLDMPARPWCAVLIYPSSLWFPESMTWLGDLEKCLAWTWLHMTKKENDE